MGIFFRRDIWANFCNMVNIFTCRCPNRSGVGAIDSPDLFQQVLDQRCIPEVSEKIFTHDISMIRRQKMVIFGVLKVFISNFTYFRLSNLFSGIDRRFQKKFRGYENSEYSFKELQLCGDHFEIFSVRNFYDDKNFYRFQFT